MDNPVKHIFTWSVTNVDKSDKAVIVSPEFSFYVDVFAYKWNLEIDPVDRDRNKIDRPPDQAYVYVSTLGVDWVSADVLFQFSVLDCELGARRKMRRSVMQEYNQGKLVTDSDIVLDCLRDGRKLVCSIHIVFCGRREQMGSIWLRGSVQKLSFPVENDMFSQNLWQQYLEQKFVDTVITVKNEEFRVHKSVLAARSAVFEKMFSQDMVEARSNTVSILDCEADVFLEILKYAYTGKFHNVELAADVLICADKYCLKDLKSYCEEILSRSLSAKNAAVIFRVADLVNAQELKEDALFVIKAQPVEVVQSEGFQKFDSRLAKEIALALAELVECRFPECSYRTRLRLSQNN